MKYVYIVFYRGMKDEKVFDGHAQLSQDFPLRNIDDVKQFEKTIKENNGFSDCIATTIFMLQPPR